MILPHFPPQYSYIGSHVTVMYVCGAMIWSISHAGVKVFQNAWMPYLRPAILILLFSFL